MRPPRSLPPVRLCFAPALVVESSCSLAHGGLLTAARVATGKTKHEVVLSAPAMDTLDLSGKVVLITGASRGPRSALAAPAPLLRSAAPLLRSRLRSALA